MSFSLSLLPCLHFVRSRLIIKAQESRTIAFQGCYVLCTSVHRSNVLNAGMAFLVSFLFYYCLKHVNILWGLEMQNSKSVIPPHSPGVVRCTTCLGFSCWHLWYWLWCVPRPPSSSATSTSALRTTAGGGAPSSPLVHVLSLFLPYLLTLTGGYRLFFSLSLPHSLHSYWWVLFQWLKEIVIKGVRIIEVSSFQGCH